MRGPPIESRYSNPFPEAHRQRRRQMAVSDAVISLDVRRGNPGLAKLLINNSRLPAPFSLIDHSNIFQRPDLQYLGLLRIPCLESTRSQIAKVTTFTEPFGNKRSICGRLKSPLPESRRCDPATCTFPAFSHSSACWLDGGRHYQVDAESRQVLGQQADTGIAPGHQDALPLRAFILENVDLGLMAPFGTLDHHAVRHRKQQGLRIRGYSDHSAGADPASCTGWPF